MTDWPQRELSDAQQLAQQGSEALRRGQADAAKFAFDQVQALLEMSSDAQRSPEVVEGAMRLRAQIYNELGVLHQRVNDPQKSTEYHRKAIELCEALRAQGVEFRANSAATHLNLSSVLAAQGDLAQARELAEHAVALVDEVHAEGDEGVLGLAMGAYQNLSLLLARAGEFDLASERMQRSLEIVEHMVDAGEKRVLPQAAQSCQRLSVLMFEGAAHEQALEWGNKALEFSEEAYESFGQEVLGIYVISQINLISYNEELGYFADAEDALWKGLEVSNNHVDILRRGLAFYENLRKQADHRLEAGDLPRDEVEDGLGDLQKIIDEMGGLPEVEEQA